MNTKELNKLQSKLDAAANVYYQAERVFRKTVRNTILRCVNKISPVDRKVVFSDYSDDVDTFVCVTYDGGNHPEYASNICSMVFGVSITEKNKIELAIEDCDEYEEYRVLTDELIDVANVLLAILERVMQNDQNNKA